MRSALQAALVGVLLVLAGCTGTLGTATDTTTATTDTTTTATTTTTTPDPERIAPGVTEAGVVDAAALASAHARFLQARSYTVERSYVERSSDGTLLTQKRSTARYERSAGELFFAQSVNGTRPALLGAAAGRVEIWSNGSTTYSRVETGGAEVSYRASSALTLSNDRYGRIYTLLSTLDTRVTERTPEGRFTLVATGVDYPRSVAPDRFDRVVNVTFEATVTVDGLVERYHVEYTGVTDDGDRVRVEETVRFVAFETTTVEAPDWVDEAAAST